MGYKIRDAQMHKVPYMLIIGQKEADEKTISVRSRFNGDEGACKIEEFINKIKQEIDTKEIKKVTA